MFHRFVNSPELEMVNMKWCLHSCPVNRLETHNIFRCCINRLHSVRGELMSQTLFSMALNAGGLLEVLFTSLLCKLT